MRGMTERPEAMLIRTPSFIPSHSFLLSPCLCTPPSLPLTIAGAARSLLHSLAFSLSCPPLPCLLPSSCSLQLPPFMFPPSFQFAPILPPSLPRSPFEPSGRRSAQCQERKGKEARGRVGGSKGGRVVREIEPLPLMKLDEGVTETCRPAEMDRKRVKRWISDQAQSLQQQLKTTSVAACLNFS